MAGLTASYINNKLSAAGLSEKTGCRLSNGSIRIRKFINRPISNNIGKYLYSGIIGFLRFVTVTMPSVT